MIDIKLTGGGTPREEHENDCTDCKGIFFSVFIFFVSIVLYMNVSKLHLYIGLFKLSISINWQVRFYLIFIHLIIQLWKFGFIRTMIEFD